MDNSTNFSEENRSEKNHSSEESHKEAAEIPPSDAGDKKVAEENFKEKFFYLAAELENVKRRFQKEKEGIIKYSNEKILQDLIEVVDNFERIMKALEKDQDEKTKNIVSGIKMVHQQFSQVLGTHGLTTIQGVGGAFDPNLHEAVSQKEVEGAKEHEIVEEYQKGYLLNGRLIRAAKVVVAK